MEIRNEIATGIVILMTFTTLIWGIPGSVRASPNTEISLTLQPEPPKVDVSYGSAAIVTMHGTVTCKKDGPNLVKVFLKGSSDYGPAPVVPGGFVFSGQTGAENTDTFSVTTRVPQKYIHYYDKTPSMLVSGYYSQGGMTYPIEPVNQTIEVEPFYKIEAQAPKPKDVAPGDTAVLNVIITNRGNNDDVYEFVFQNLEKLCQTQWQVKTITPVNFKAGETKVISTAIKPPKTNSDDHAEIVPCNLRILSQKSMEEGGNVRVDVPIFVRLKEAIIPEFCPTLALFGLLFVLFAFRKKVFHSYSKGDE